MGAELSPEVIDIAEKQAALDRALLAKLQARADELNAEKQEAMTIVTDHPVDEDDVPVARVPMNRAQRRAQVAMYAMLLRETERQTPVRNATVIPRAKRRRQKGGRRA